MIQNNQANKSACKTVKELYFLRKHADIQSIEQKHLIALIWNEQRIYQWIAGGE
jgi:hypothetical protein